MSTGDNRSIIRKLQVKKKIPSAFVKRLQLDVKSQTSYHVLNNAVSLRYKRITRAPAMKSRREKARIGWALKCRHWESSVWVFIVSSVGKKRDLDGTDGLKFQ